MTEIDFSKYGPSYREYARKQYSANTAEKRIYAVNELIEYFQKQETTIDTDDFYDSVDKIRDFFDQTNVHNTKVSGIRDFLDYVGGQQDSRTEDQVDDIRDKIRLAKLQKSNSNSSTSESGELDKKEVEEKLLEDEEIDAAREAADFETQVMINVMMDSGMRPGELAALKPRVVNFNSTTVGAAVKIEDTYIQNQGLQGKPKHDSFRTVELTESTAANLQQLIEENDVDDDELIFQNYQHIYRRLKDAFTTAQVRVDEDGNDKTNVTPHWLRHNACTRLIQDHRKEDVQRYMGHKSIKITEIYEHFKEDEVIGLRAGQ